MTRRPFGYLLLDLHPKTSTIIRLGENIFPVERRLYWIYRPLCRQGWREKIKKKHVHFLQALATTHPLQKRALLKTAKNEQIEILCEICLNILAGNIAVDVDRMKKYKNLFRNLARKKSSIQQKNKMLVNDSGGIFTAFSSCTNIYARRNFRTRDW